MKTIVLASVALAAVAFAGSAAAANPQVEAPIHQFINAFNKGDMKTAGAAFLPSPSIIDEVPPHIWQGPNAFSAWAADLQKEAAAAGMTGAQVTLGKVTDEIVSGTTAYVVFEATFTYTQNGAPMREPAHMVYALRKGADWKIAGWAWDGTTPQPAKPPAKPSAK